MNRISGVRDCRLWIGTFAHTWHSNHRPICPLYKRALEKRQRTTVQVAVQEPVAVTVANPWQPLLPWVEVDDDVQVPVEVDHDVYDMMQTLQIVSAICDFIVRDLEGHEGYGL